MMRTSRPTKYMPTCCTSPCRSASQVNCVYPASVPNKAALPCRTPRRCARIRDVIWPRAALWSAIAFVHVRHLRPRMGTKQTENSVETHADAVPVFDEGAGRPRMVARIAFLFFWTLGWFGVRLAVFPVAVIGGPAERRLRTAVLRAWAAGVCAVMSARIAVRGPLPKPPFFLVSNHLGYFDVIVYARLLGCVFVSMAEVGTWPLIGTLARGLNTLFIDRKRRRDAARVNDEIRQTIEKGHGLLLFPESTTTYGDKLLPFHGALLQPAIDLGRPVHYAAISYATAPGQASAGHAICWVDDTPFATHALRLLRLRRFDVTVTFGASPLIENDRKLLATALHTAVESIVLETKG